MNEENDRILIGVDAGATNCRVAITNPQGHRIAEAHGGPANIANDYSQARMNIVGTIDKALREMNLSSEAHRRVHAYIGVAGSNLGDFGARLEGDLPFADQRVSNDVRISIAGALREHYGILAALGTGSVFARQDANGFKMFGGWGFLMGDEGSGAKLGYHLLERSIYAEDGLYEHSPLTREIIAGYRGHVGNLVEDAKRMAPHEFGHFAPRVIDAYHKGDHHAQFIMNEAVAWIEQHIDAAGFNDDSALCLLGGLGPIYLPLLNERYQRKVIEPLGNALDGAIYLAIKTWAT